MANVLIDIAGVLHVDYVPIEGSIEAYKKLKQSGIPYKFVTNTDMHTRQWMVNRLRDIGFDISEAEV
jgi:ribonucleotide monophosphatase NagD (HAD superfamily)